MKIIGPSPNRREFLQALALFGLSASRLDFESLGPVRRPEVTPASSYRRPGLVVITLRVAGPVEQPLSVSLDAELRGPNGAAMRVPGFYRGNGTFEIRLSPSVAGRWDFETSSTIKGLTGLHGSVVAPEPGHRSSLEEGGRFMPQALHDLHVIDWDDLHDRVRARRLIESLPKPSGRGPGSHWQCSLTISMDSFRGIGSDESFATHESLERLEGALAQLTEANAIVHVVLTESTSTARATSASIEARRFEHVVARYQAFPVIWNLGGLQTSEPRELRLIEDRVARVRHLDGHRRLLTVLNEAYCLERPEEVDYMTIKNWTTSSYQLVRAIRARQSTPLVLNSARLS